MNSSDPHAPPAAETVLVCLANPAHAEDLVKRGMNLAGLVPGSALILLHVRAADPESVEFTDLFHHDVFERLSAKFGAELIEREATRSRVAEAICAVIRQRGVSQVVLGQSPGSRLARLFRQPLSSLVSGMQKEADIHIVAMPEGLYDSLDLDSGIRCVAIPGEDGRATLTFDQEAGAGRPGWFFRRSSTEFDHGYFVPWPAAAMEVHRVADGIVQAVVARRVGGGTES